MKKLNPLLGLVVSLIFTAPLIGIMYIADQLADLPFLPFDFFDWIAFVTPGNLLTFGIDLMIDTLRFFGGAEAVTNAKIAERIMAVGMFAGVGLVIGLLFFVLIRFMNVKPSARWALILTAVFGLPMIGIYLSASQSGTPLFLALPWLIVLFALWGFGVNWAARRLLGPDSVEEEVAAEAPQNSVETLNRRQFLIRLGASTATITAVSGGLGGMLAQAEEAERLAAGNAGSAGTNITSFPNDGDAIIPAPGTRPEYTPIPDHYQVFLRTEPSLIEEADWTLPIGGMVDNPLNLTLTDIRNNYPSRDQFVTLSCISGRIATGLISTTMWTGVSAQDLLASVGVQEGARYLDIESADGFHEIVDLELINNDARIMFAYDWDGQPIPKDHGFPLRIWIPDLYGMKQPKWITGMTVTDEYRQGYWVERNWDEIAQVKTTSVIDTVALDDVETRLGQTIVPVGGIAWAGDRQISKVEVRVDDGEWQEAQLRTPLSETTWVVWRYEWAFQEGEHTFEVRCQEADGTAQIETRKTQRPDGATGIHSFDI
ncbi:MAG: molybdopterin-dependent oxidoreductase [Chloroflexota bacterium]